MWRQRLSDEKELASPVLWLRICKVDSNWIPGWVSLAPAIGPFRLFSGVRCRQHSASEQLRLSEELVMLYETETNDLGTGSISLLRKP